MVRQSFLTTLTICLMLFSPLAECWGRGFGGGGRGGGGAGRSPGGFSGGHSPGGGFSGAAGFSPGGFSGASAGRSPMSQGGSGAGGAGQRPGGFSAGRSPSGFGGAGQGPSAFGAGQRPGAAGGNRGAAGPGAGRSQFSSPSRSQLSSFLGLPSDGGMHGLGSASAGRGGVGVGTDAGVGGGAPGAGVSRNRAGSLGVGAGDVGVGTSLGVGGGAPGAGASRNRAGSLGVGAGDVGVGTDLGVGGGAPGAGASRNRAGSLGVGAGDVGVGTDLGVGGGRPGPGATRNRAGSLGVGVGDIGVGTNLGVGGGRPGIGLGGFSPVRASTRYTTATAVRGSFNHWDVYGRGWRARYPGAWFAAGWAAGAVWRACTWGNACSYCGYYETPPVYYDYGNNVTYEGDTVYVNGDSVGTSEQYYDQAVSVASTGAQAEAPTDGDWMPLGVFALSKPEQPTSDVSIQLAVNKQGVIRGNYTDNTTNKNQIVQGSVDKQTQRVAFTIGQNTTDIVETGLYNLTKDEAPCLIHFGKDRTEQWLLVRLQQPETAGN